MSGVFALALSLLVIGAHAEAPPARVVSINFCADQLALLLAAPGQLRSVTWIAHDPARNPLAARAKGLDSNQGEAEEILALRPDLVLAGTLTTRTTIAALRRRGIAVVELPPPQSLAALSALTMTVGTALGRRGAAEALLAEMPPSAALAATRERALLVGPAGSIAGEASLGGDLLRAAGFDNLGARLPRRPWSNLSIEEMRFLRPDILFTADEDRAADSLAQALLAHPALTGAGSFRHVTIPAGAFSCAPPLVARAFAALREAANRP
jgi:iron complex transport system substrate-binding protein